ncbi:MAG: site-2 protease family protein [Thermoguttaceae bacterium]
MLTIIWSIVLVVLGINALIIIHELGHFLVARACGVRCEKFYIWFDFWGLKFFKFRWGETEYGLGVFPLGGYVKMLGQEDNPGELAAELQRAKDAAATNDPNAAPRDVAALERAVYAPDSFLAKSVPQRMAIISAGVIMNFLFAFVCAAGAYGLGFKQVAPYVGGTVAGSPAWQADLQVGDRLDKVGNRTIPSFGDLRQMVLDAGGTVSLTWSRPSTKDKETFTRDLFEAQNKGDLLPSIGVFPMRTLDVYRETPIAPSFESFYATDVSKQLGAAAYRVAAINASEVTSYADFTRGVNGKLGEPVECTFAADGAAPLTITLPAVPMKTLGEIRFAMGPITAIQDGSTAAAAGVKVGDTIVAVEGIETLDPLRLPYQLQRRANSVANGGVTECRITLENSRGERREVTVPMNPRGEYTEPRSLKDVLALAPLGIAYSVPPRLAGGERVTDIIFRDVDEATFAKTSFSGWMSEGWFGPRIGFAIHRLGDAIDIPFVMLSILQECKPETPIRLIVDGVPRELVVTEAVDWCRADRGLVLNTETFTMKADSFLSACSLGWGRMVESSLSVYTFLANLGNRVSAKAMGGPVAIVGIAYSVANEGPALFLLFLCLIGANLAVINLLPIPVLDGGHLVFLAYEAIFRKPPNESIQVALSYLGLFLILGLMIWSLSLDLGFIPRM